MGKPIRHIQKLSLTKPEPVKWHPNDDPNWEIQHWGVRIKMDFSPQVSYLSSVPLTENDLKRLIRVLRRGIRKLHENK